MRQARRPMPAHPLQTNKEQLSFERARPIPPGVVIEKQHVGVAVDFEVRKMAILNPRRIGITVAVGITERLDFGAEPFRHPVFAELPKRRSGPPASPAILFISGVFIRFPDDSSEVSVNHAGFCNLSGRGYIPTKRAAVLIASFSIGPLG